MDSIIALRSTSLAEAREQFPGCLYTPCLLCGTTWVADPRYEVALVAFARAHVAEHAPVGRITVRDGQAQEPAEPVWFVRDG